LFVAVIGYAIYTMVSTDSAFALGVYFGAIASLACCSSSSWSRADGVGSAP
jgi:hypothetical protein